MYGDVARMYDVISRRCRSEQVKLRKKEKKKKAEEERKKRIQQELPEQQKNVLETIISILETNEEPTSERVCPECQRNFFLIDILLENPNKKKRAGKIELEIDGCKFCKSLWFDSEELRTVTEQSRDVPSENLASRKSTYPCPVCDAAMNQYVYKAPDNIIVDKCLNGHGVYLESGELERIFKTLNN
ncbi:MAG: zf-TFIIB domain-containing protein [bacterium]|nr:zf-TFIIB domain-containing protein [bacterium]